MTTALSTSFYLPDVMALKVGYVGRFAQGGGLEDLAREPYRIREIQAQFAPYAFKQATSRAGAVVAAPPTSGRARCCTAPTSSPGRASARPTSRARGTATSTRA
jgi:hypothetical protein